MEKERAHREKNTQRSRETFGMSIPSAAVSVFDRGRLRLPAMRFQAGEPLLLARQAASVESMHDGTIH